MKKIVLMMSLAVMVLFVGCNKKQEQPVAEGNATVSVVVKGADLKGAYGENDAVVGKLVAMVYKGEQQEAIKEGADGALEVLGIECTAGERTLVVVANVGNKNLAGMTLANLKKETLELAAEHQDPENKLLLMTAEPVTVNLVSGKNYYGFTGKTDGTNHSEGVPLKLTRVHAGMALVGATVEFSDAYDENYGVTFNEGALIGLIVKKQSNIFGAPLANADPNYLYGEEVVSGTYTPGAYTLEESLRMDLNHSDLKPAGMEGFGFYVLENEDTEHPTILCLKGKLTKANGDNLSADEMQAAFAAGWIVSATDPTTYYPVVVNGKSNHYQYNGEEGAGTQKLVRNHKYNITIKITGPGTNKPEEPQDEKANLDVKVEIVQWKLVAQNVVW